MFKNKEKNSEVVAYLSMEIAVAEEIKTYAGGLGILAGDLLRAAARERFPLVGVTLLSRQGYFKQAITAGGEQAVQPDSDYDFSRLKKLETQVEVKIKDETVKVGVWQYLVSDATGGHCPVYFLDTDLPDNSASNRQLTGQLYGGDQEYRLRQEIILGRGGVKILAALGYTVKKYHLNEGHGALAAVELFLSAPGRSVAARIAAVRSRCVFTTHTPLKKEQDVFPLSYFLEYQPDFPATLSESSEEKTVNMTALAFFFSGFSNAVSKRHQKTAAQMFPGIPLQFITNGVDSPTWTAPDFQKLFDYYLPGWRQDQAKLAEAERIPVGEIYAAHQTAKKELLNYVETAAGLRLDPEIFTLVFARRFAPYKRPEFLFQNIDRLLKIAGQTGGLQIIYAGKAHPSDLEGQALIRKIEGFKRKLSGRLPMVFLENYDLNLARLLTAGADLWLNTPLPPNEASGTSGMKAAHSGVPQLSTLDGWWPEGYRRGKTGWAIKEDRKTGQNNLYDLLEREVLPLYYGRPEAWLKLMRSTIAYNASYFNTQRVLREYIKKAYK